MGGVGSGKKRVLTNTERKKRKSAYMKAWREKNKQKLASDIVKWREKNKDRFLEINRNYKQRVKEKALKKYWYDLKYEREHPGRTMKWYYANREKRLAYAKAYREKKRMEAA